MKIPTQHPPTGHRVTTYERAADGYGGMVLEWLGNPHAYFRAFGPEARGFQARHRSERLRTMTLVAAADELAALRPVCLSVDGAEEPVGTWERTFAIATARLLAAHPLTFAALQRDGLLDWLGCASDGVAVSELLADDRLCPCFPDLTAVVFRIQWLFLMCGIRLNEVIVQVDPYTDGEWALRHADICRKRAADRAFLAGRRAAQQAWAAEHAGGGEGKG